MVPTVCFTFLTIRVVIFGKNRLPGQIPVQVYQLNPQEKNDPSSRINEIKNKTLYPLSIEIVNSKEKQELWIYTHAATSNPKQAAIVFSSSDAINQFLDLIDPGFVKKQYHNIH